MTYFLIGLGSVILLSLLSTRFGVIVSCFVLFPLVAYVVRRFTRAQHTPNRGSITVEEAYEILGLNLGASVQEIRETHRRLMVTIHPDKGGSTYLATQLNQAKDLLLKSKK